MSGITASNLRRIDKPTRHGGTVLASVDLTIPAWHMKISCLWMANAEGEWIALPSAKFVNREGRTSWQKLVEFTDEKAYKRFQDAALAAAHKLNDGMQKSPERPDSHKIGAQGMPVHKYPFPEALREAARLNGEYRPGDHSRS
jgi:hypothetical protein